ncbi:hypothetical protein Hanom_Chr16g01511091 [Helianthus anomalus]
MTVLAYGLNFCVSYGLMPTYYINDNVMVGCYVFNVFYVFYNAVLVLVLFMLCMQFIVCCFGIL